MPRVLRGSWGGGRFLMSKVPLSGVPGLWFQVSGLIVRGAEFKVKGIGLRV